MAFKSGTFFPSFSVPPLVSVTLHAIYNCILFFSKPLQTLASRIIIPPNPQCLATFTILPQFTHQRTLFGSCFSFENLLSPMHSIFYYNIRIHTNRPYTIHTVSVEHIQKYCRAYYMYFTLYGPQPH